jgi:hypothetical protein
MKRIAAVYNVDKPILPFAVWIAAVDLLCLETWQVDAYTVGPQPWELWHADGYTPERAVMELSTPTTPPDLEDDSHLLNHPTVTTNYGFRRIMDNENALLIPPDDLHPGEVIEIALRYLDIQEAVTYPPPSREDKIRALARLGITVEPDQHPLTAWMFAMCRENGLPEQRPSIPIGETAQELCPKWVWWLA